MILNDEVINEWIIYSAYEFKKKFKIKEKRDDNECDEDYIMEHLKKDKRKFRVYFNESARGKAEEEYWVIKEVKK